MKYLVTLLIAISSHAASWYASPASLESDFTNTSKIVAGDALWLRGGTYGHGSNVFTCYLSGTPNAPITVRGYPGERAIIDGGIYTWASANWVTFQDFEITCSNPRLSTYANRPAGLVLSSLGHKAINLVIRDSGHPGILGNPGEVYGCIISGVGISEYGTGVYTTNNPWTRGSGLYLQNNGVQQIIASDNISSRCWTDGMKAYAENIFASGVTFDGNILFYNGGGIENECLYHSISNSVVVNNVEFQNGKTALGYFQSPTGELAQHENLIVTNNYIVDSPGSGSATLWLRRWRKLNVSHNTITTVSPLSPWKCGTGTGSDMAGHFIELNPSTNSSLDYVIDQNEYHGGVEQDADWYSFTRTNGVNTYGMFYHTYQPFRFKVTSVDIPDGTNGLLSFGAWQNAHGFDVSSTYTTNLPTQNFVSLRPNKYETGRGNLVVFNWQSNSTETVDISRLGLANNQGFEVRDVQDYFGNPVVIGRYKTATRTVTIPMKMESPFNAFVVIPKSSRLKFDRMTVSHLKLESTE